MKGPNQRKFEPKYQDVDKIAKQATDKTVKAVKGGYKKFVKK